jgi:hypothetical protein
MRLWAPLTAAATLAIGLTVPLAPEPSVAPAATPAVASSASFRFAAGGDMGYSPEADATLRAEAASGAEFALHFGDMAYDQMKPEPAWCRFVQERVGATFPYELVTGGHDLNEGEGDIDKYAACLPDRLHSTGIYGREYFFDYPAANPLARVIMVSPSITFPDGQTYDYGKGTPHYQWLVDAIDSARAAGIRWVVVGMARNCITAGEKHCEIGPDTFNLLVDKRVDLILEGHEHGYERSKQLASGSNCPEVTRNGYNPACVVDDGADGVYTKGAGPIIVVAGTLGIALRPMHVKDPEAPYFVTLMGSNMNPTHGMVKFTVTGTDLRAEFVRAAGGTFTDSFTIAPPTTAPAPSPAPAQ